MRPGTAIWEGAVMRPGPAIWEGVNSSIVDCPHRDRHPEPIMTPTGPSPRADQREYEYGPIFHPSAPIK